MTTADDEALNFYLAESQWPFHEWGGPESTLEGPVGLCWANARSHALTDPDRLLYAEGVVWNRGYPELHGWAVDRHDGSVIETTTGYASASRYRGLVFHVPTVEDFANAADRRAHYVSGGAFASDVPGVVLVLFDELHDKKIEVAGLVKALRGLAPVVDLCPQAPSRPGSLGSQ